jgi:hypothetical protein
MEPYKYDHHESKYVNRGKSCKTLRYKYQAGTNVISPSGSRGSTIKSRRLNNLTANKQIAQNMFIDVNPVTITPFPLPRKSIIPTGQHYEEKWKQNKQVPVRLQHNLPKVADDVKLLHLCEISDRLFIGNVNCTKNLNLLKLHNVGIIINCSNSMLGRVLNVGNYACVVHDVEYTDTRYISYNTFINILLTVTDIIDSTAKNVLIICEKCVNRSPSLAIAYAINKNIMNFSQAMSYIENMKFMTNPDWNNLTNNRIKNLLKVVSQRKKF